MKCGHCLSRSRLISSRASPVIARPTFKRRDVRNDRPGPEFSGRATIDSSGSKAWRAPAERSDAPKSNDRDQPAHDKDGGSQPEASELKEKQSSTTGLALYESDGSQEEPEDCDPSSEGPHTSSREVQDTPADSSDQYAAESSLDIQQSTHTGASVVQAAPSDDLPAESPTAQASTSGLLHDASPSSSNPAEVDHHRHDQGPEHDLSPQTVTPQTVTPQTGPPIPDSSVPAGESFDDASGESGNTSGILSVDDGELAEESADEGTESEDSEKSSELQGTKIAPAPDLMTSRQMPTVLSESEPDTDAEDFDASSTARDGAGSQDRGASLIGRLLPGFPRLLPAPRPLPALQPRTAKPLKQLLPLKPGLMARAVQVEDGTLFSFTPAVSGPSGTPVDMVEDAAAASYSGAAISAQLEQAAAAPQEEVVMDPLAADEASVAENPAVEAAPDVPTTALGDIQPEPVPEDEARAGGPLLDDALATVPGDRNAPDPARPGVTEPAESAPAEPPTTDAASPDAVAEELEEFPASAEVSAELLGPAGGSTDVDAADGAEGAYTPAGDAVQVEDYFTDVEYDSDDGGPPMVGGAEVGIHSRPGDMGKAAAKPRPGTVGGAAADVEVDVRLPADGAITTSAANADGGMSTVPQVGRGDGGGMATGSGSSSAGPGATSQADGRAAAAQFLKATSGAAGSGEADPAVLERERLAAQHAAAQRAAQALRSGTAAAGDGARAALQRTEPEQAALAAGSEQRSESSDEGVTGDGALVAYGSAPVDGDGQGASVAIVPGGEGAHAADVPPIPDGVREDRPTDVSTALAARAVAGAQTGYSLMQQRAPASPATVPLRLANAAEAAAASAAAVHANARPRTDSPFVTAGSMDEADGAPRREPPPETIIHPFHLTLFAILLVGGVAFAITVINFTTDMGWVWSSVRVLRKLAKSLAFRQTIALLVAIAFVRYGLEPLVRSVRSVFALPGPWERSNEYFILKQVYQPLEFLLFVAAISTVVEAVLPPLVAVQKETVRTVVRTMLSLTYVIASAFVVFNVKARIVQEKCWQAEIMGDTAAQRSIEATDKLLTVLFLFVAALLGLQAIGLDIQSVLAISGFGGLALGLAGREILENLFNGLLIVSSRSFEVGEEIMFTQSGHAGRIIEGIIMDIGWYRTMIRSFEREVYIVPNSVFSRTVVLNVTRKGKEWRVFENIGVRVEDIAAIPDIVNHMRRIIREDSRVLPKLHRRVFLDKVQRDQLTVYISFYIEAANRDAFMATKQEIFMQFATACARHGAKLAQNRHQVELMPSGMPNGSNGGSGSYPVTPYPQSYLKGFGDDMAAAAAAAGGGAGEDGSQDDWDNRNGGGDTWGRRGASGEIRGDDPDPDDPRR